LDAEKLEGAGRFSYFGHIMRMKQEITTDRPNAWKDSREQIKRTTAEEVDGWGRRGM